MMGRINARPAPMSIRSALLLLACSAGAAAAAPPEIVFLAPLNHAMPVAQFDNGALTGGILKDLGDAIAARLKRQARYVPVPSKRVSMALVNREGDGVCYVLPAWIDGDFNWTVPVVPNSVAVVAHGNVPVIHQLTDLADIRVGTVLGYRYGPLWEKLGGHLKRDDAASTQLAIGKLMAGRVDYAVLETLTVDWYLRTNHATGLRTDLVFYSFVGRCAFNKSSSIPFKDIDRAVTDLVGSGAVDAILARYR
jgi:ABC-type amino acid transport substrate-binding protein